MNFTDKSYPEFFKEDLYGGFVQYLLDEYGSRQVITVLRDEQLVTKKGVHPMFRRDFNTFLSKNPDIWTHFTTNFSKFFNMKNIADGDLRFPIDTEDDDLMVREGVRVPALIPVRDNITRASKEMKRSAGPMKGQVIRGEVRDKYRVPKRLTVHFKEGFARKIKKTTMSFMVDSRSEAMHILLDRYEKRVAYAIIQGEEEFCFVKPRNGKKKRTGKLRG